MAERPLPGRLQPVEVPTRSGRPGAAQPLRPGQPGDKKLTGKCESLSCPV
jgi:hypothetical protein